MKHLLQATARILDSTADGDTHLSPSSVAPNGDTRSGHLMHAVVSPTVEIFITTGPAVLDKAQDAVSGMTMFP